MEYKSKEELEIYLRVLSGHPTFRKFGITFDTNKVCKAIAKKYEIPVQTVTDPETNKKTHFVISSLDKNFSFTVAGDDYRYVVARALNMMLHREDPIIDAEALTKKLKNKEGSKDD